MTKCCWMGIPLRSPVVLASLTLFSKPDIEKHLAYFRRAQEHGVGAIVLPSISPVRRTEAEGFPHVRTATIPTGLHTPRDHMGFAVLGTEDNIVSIDYGLALAEKAVGLAVPIVGSLANVGSEEDLLAAARRLLSVRGLAGVELNFSCPAVKHGSALSAALLERIQEENVKGIPVTIKLSPRASYESIQGHEELFQGVTLSNAYTGLVPPHTSLSDMSPFADMELWRPTGIYGPQEKLFTFYDIWRFKTAPETRDVQLSSVGGFVNGTDVIQALMLGADSVQLSSAVFWKGLSVIRDVNEALARSLAQDAMTVEQMKGIGLDRIVGSDCDLPKLRPARRMHIDRERCKKCDTCACIDRGCYAISQESGNALPRIDDALCSGCGWCRAMCRFGAVAEIRP